MSAHSPTHMFCWTAEQIHLFSAAIHYFGVYHFPSPYGGILEATLIVPLTTFGLRYAIPKGFMAFSRIFHCIGDGFEVASKLPQILGRYASRFRGLLGRVAKRVADYLQQGDAIT